MSELAKQRITENKRTQAKSLDLGNCGLTELPPELLDCRWVKNLNLGYSYYDEEKQRWEESKNQGEKNKIKDLAGITKLKNLRILSFSFNEVTNISPLKELVNLQKLHFSFNEVTNIFPLKELVNLQSLDFNSNRITDISPLKGLVNLQKLSFDKNKVSDISPLQELVNLQKLDFSFNEVTNISPLKELVNLQNLSFDKNKVSDISSLKRLKKIKYLFIYGNPVKGIPVEYLGKGVDDNCIKKVRYYLEQEEKNSQYVFEAKLVLVGEPGAGKTSLSEKIRNPDYKLKTGNQSEPMTRGVAVSQWPFDYANPKHTPTHAGFDGQFIAHIFDFGGQDILHATHRYFFSRRTVYLLVVDTRPEDTDFYYWLNVIELFGEQSPVIIVMNDKHDVYKQVPAHIVEKFAHLINNRIFYVNLRNNQGLTDLINMIQRELQQLPHVGTEKHYQSWIKVRQELNKKWLPDGILESLQVWKAKNEKKPFLTRQEYIDICENFGVFDEDKAMQIADTLHILGSILYFQDNPALIDTLILDKHWATEAVYWVLLDKTVNQNNGKFTKTDLERIWKGKYPIERHHALLALMLSFKIAYRVKDSETYIATQLLPENPPVTHKTLFEPTTIFTHFEFHYPKFMPKALLARLIVEMNKSIHQNYQWRYGVVLLIYDCLVEITEHRYGSTNKIAIRATGKEPLKALAVVYHTFSEIHGEFPNLVYEEMIPCNCEKCKKSNEPEFFEYSVLQEFLRDREPKIQCRKSRKMVSVQELLEGRKSYENYLSQEAKNLLFLIEENKIPEFYQALDRLEVSDYRISELKQKFIAGDKTFQYHDQLEVWVREYFKER